MGAQVICHSHRAYSFGKHSQTPLKCGNWIQEVSGAESLGEVQFYQWSDLRISSTFPALRYGFPFLWSQPYHYDVWFREDPPQLLTFVAPESIPEVDPRPSILMPDKGLAGFIACFKREQKVLKAKTGL
jgi:hypothetical protein